MNALRLLMALTVMALAGCQVSQRAEADPLEYELNQVFTVGGGHEAVKRGEDLRLRFAEVLEDSRCPKLVACFWTGRARIAVLVLRAGRDPTTAEFNTKPAPGQNVQTAQVGEYAIGLQALDPYPQTPEESTSLEDYRATFSVRKA
ncbi:MAG: hypothetical protein ACREJT_07935 [Myxococcota bacterium]